MRVLRRGSGAGPRAVPPSQDPATAGPERPSPADDFVLAGGGWEGCRGWAGRVGSHGDWEPSRVGLDHRVRATPDCYPDGNGSGMEDHVGRIRGYDVSPTP